MTYRGILAICSILVCLTGCTKELKMQGYNFATAKPDVLKVGISTRQEVLETLGTPTSESDFGDKQYFYISRKVEQIAFLEPRILEQDVLSITFNKDDLISHINHNTLDDANNILFAREMTEIKGNSLTAVQQILTNVGKYRKK